MTRLIAVAIALGCAACAFAQTTGDVNMPVLAPDSGHPHIEQAEPSAPLSMVPAPVQHIVIDASPATVTTVQLRVSGSLQSAQTTKRNFGRLPRGYRAADWTVTNESAQPIKVSLARLLQEIHPGPGVAILSGVSATSVVQDAQGSNPLNTVARVGTGIVSGLAVGEGLKIIPSRGSWPTVILGAEIGTLILQYVFPTLQTHALQSITAMMPPVISLDAAGSDGSTVSGMVIVELAPKAPAPAPLDIVIAIAIPAAAKL